MQCWYCTLLSVVSCFAACRLVVLTDAKITVDPDMLVHAVPSLLQERLHNRFCAVCSRPMRHSAQRDDVYSKLDVHAHH